MALQGVNSEVGDSVKSRAGSGWISAGARPFISWACYIDRDIWGVDYGAILGMQSDRILYLWRAFSLEKDFETTV